MKKQWTAVLLALVLAAALLPAAAHAAQTGSSAGDRLMDTDRAVYDVLRTEVEKIANGTRSSTSINIPDQSVLSWTLDELDLPGSGREELRAKLEEKFNEIVHMSRIFHALWVDCPYELYWADNQFTWSYSSLQQGGRVKITNLTVSIPPARDYQGGSSGSVSAAKVSQAAQAAANAQAIVDKYQDQSDYGKLSAYLEEICGLTSYNMDAYENDVSYGDPFQLVYVFDGDPDTNVVCEGYAKAFQYLCDLSGFDGDVTCYTVSGTMNGVGHMWNVVRVGDGRNYLVDVTNCDSGMIGSGGKLFLTGGSSENSGQVCTISKEGCRAVYSCDPDQQGLFTDGFLPLSAEDYVDTPYPSTPAEPTGGASSLEFTDVAEGAYYAEAVAWAVEQGITIGTSDTTFSPDKLCTEAEILTFLWRAAGEPDNMYGVTEGGSFYAQALFWAYGIGMLNPSMFSPDTPCTRLSAVSFIWWDFRFRDPAPDESFYGCFDDVAGDSPHAEAVAWAVERGITTGTSPTTFDPDLVCTRGQIVTFLYRAYH